MSAQQERATPLSVLMEDANGRTVIVPGVKLLPMDRLQYGTFVKKVLTANEHLAMNVDGMRSLWESVVNRVYYFECVCTRAQMLAVVSTSLTQYGVLP